MQFILFHGAFGNSSENWLPWLKRELEKLDQTVFVPQFPVDDWDEVTQKGLSVKPKHQNLYNWLREFEKLQKKLDPKQKICFVGHSLACVLMLHVIDKFNLSLSGGIFVSPFLEKLNRLWQIDHANASFYKTDFNFERLKKQIGGSYVVYSDNDPYVATSYPIQFAEKLESKRILVKNAKHFNGEAGFTEFPLILDLCRGIVKYPS